MIELMNVSQLITMHFSVVIQITVSASASDVIEWKGDILVVGTSALDLEKDENGSFKNSTLRKLDDVLKGILATVVIEEDFTAKSGQYLIVRLSSGYGFKRIGLVAYQNSGQVLNPAKWKSFGESVVTATKNVQATSLCITLANSGHVDESALHVRARSIAMGMSFFKLYFGNSWFEFVELEI